MACAWRGVLALLYGISVPALMVSPTAAPTPAPVAPSTPATVLRCDDHSVVVTQPLDVEIRENDDHGSAQLRIAVDRDTNLGEARALINFPGISSIPSGANITSAQLRFFTRNPTSASGAISGYTMSVQQQLDGCERGCRSHCQSPNFVFLYAIHG